MSHNLNASILEQQNDIYFGTEVVNRISFLREDLDFVTDSLLHPSTRFVFFEENNPLIYKYGKGGKLVILTNGEKQSDNHVNAGLLKGLPLWKKTLEAWSEDNKNHSPSTRGVGKPYCLFLGLQDESVGLNLKSLKISDEESDDERYLDFQGRYQGIPYYAIDLTNSKELSEQLQKFFLGQVDSDPEKSAVENGLMYTTSRKHYLGFTHVEASLYSQGSMFLDWLRRNKFCPGCGAPTIPIHAGGKLQCTRETKADCSVQSAPVSNASFPRTDAVIITAVTNVERTKILLSLSKRHAATRMYACTAGFMEPSETVEVATKREIWEETGVKCSKINIVMTQPWPFPGNLMIGCVAEVEFNGKNEVIHLGHDKELSDARWFDIDFVRNLVYRDSEEYEKEDFNPEGILIPFPESIAFSLINLVVNQAGNKKSRPAENDGKL